MDVRQLEYVVAVAEEGSFTRAAQRCHIAQSALSHQMARLENEVGTKLFVRTSRSVRLSEGGRALLPHARRVLGDMSDARGALDALAGIVRGRLRIGMTQTASRALDLIAVIGQIHRRFPDVTLATATGPGPELVEVVRDGHLDLAVAARIPTGPLPGITFSPLIASEPLMAVVADDHPLASRKRVHLGDLADCGFIEFRPGTTLRQVVDMAFADAGVQRRSNFEVGQIADMVHYVGHGLGIAIVPRTFTRPEPPNTPHGAKVHVLRLVNPTLSLTIGAYRRGERASTLTDAFLQLAASNTPPRTTPAS